MGLSNYVPNSRISQAGVIPNSAARPASPYEGQMVYQTDDNALYIFDGSNWVKTVSAAQPPAMQLVGTFTASGTSRTLSCDNVFTSTFTNYKVVIKLATTSQNNTLYFRYINTSGAVISASYFSAMYSRDIATAGAGAVTVNNSTTVGFLGWIPNGVGNPLGAEITIYNPLGNEWTTHNGQYTGINSGVAYQAGELYGVCNPTPPTMRGIEFDNGAGTNLTGVVSIYGYRL